MSHWIEKLSLEELSELADLLEWEIQARLAAKAIERMTDAEVSDCLALHEEGRHDEAHKKELNKLT